MKTPLQILCVKVLMLCRNKPGLVINGKVVLKGRVPSAKELKEIIADRAWDLQNDMEIKKELKILGWITAVFAFAFFLPVDSSRFNTATSETLDLVKWYAQIDGYAHYSFNKVYSFQPGWSQA